MTAMAQALRMALLHFVWQGVLVAFLLWMTLFLLRRRSSQARYLASCTALALLAALPVITASVVYRAPVGSEGAAVSPRAMPLTAGIVSKLESVEPTWMVRLEPWALPLWSAGVLLFSLRLVWGCCRVARMRRRGQPVEAALLSLVTELGSRMGLLRPVRVLTASLPDGPSVVGWLRPVLLLPPATILGLTPDQLEAVLAHELAHIRRYDHLVNAAQSLVEALLFYHPAVWWTSARIRDERELCCDDLAVQVCGDALCFARALTKLERLRMMTPAMALGSTGGPLMYRVQRLINAGPQECAPSKLSGIVAFSLGLLFLSVSVGWVHAQEGVPMTAGHFTLRVFAGARDSAGVAVDVAGAQLLHRSAIEYPEPLRESGIQGTVVAQVSLDASGSVSDARVLSGPMELRKTLMKSIFEWHFSQDAAGSTRTVSVTFQKPAADAKPGPPAAGAEGDVAEYAFVNAPEERRQDELLQNQIRERRAAMERGDVNATRGTEEPAQAGASGVITYVSPTVGWAEGGVETARTERGVEVREELIRRHSLDGRTLTKIEVSNLPDAAKEDLISKMPLHVGDTFTETSLELAGAAIRKFDEHLRYRVMVEHDGISLHIDSPEGSVRTGK